MKLLARLLLLLLLLLLFLLLLPLVSRIFAPAVRCPESKYPNDQDFRFCGFRKPVVPAARPLTASPDIFVIDNRLDQLQGIALFSAYAKQKASLKSYPSFSVLCREIRLFFPNIAKRQMIIHNERTNESDN